MTFASAALLPTALAEAPSETPQSSSQVIQAREVLKHDKRDDCWIAIEGKIYDVTEFLEQHVSVCVSGMSTVADSVQPGGAGFLLQYAGKDATQAFKPLHPKGTLEKALPPNALVGFVDPTTSYLLDASAAGFGEPEEERQKRRDELPPVASIQNLKQFEEMAERVLGKKSPSMVFYRSVAEDGVGECGRPLAPQSCLSSLRASLLQKHQRMVISTISTSRSCPCRGHFG